MTQTLNQVTLIGYVGNISEGSYEGTFWMRFSIATENLLYNKDKNAEQTYVKTYHSVSVWRNQALLCKKNLREGDLISVTGEIRYEKDKVDKTKLWTKIYIPEYGGKIIFLGSGKRTSETTQPKQSAPQTPHIDGPKPFATSANKFKSNVEDDIPF